MAMTYTSLVEDLIAVVRRGFAADTVVADAMNGLINRAEEAIALALDVQGFETTVLGAMTAGTSVYAKPERWGQTLSMAIGTGASGLSRVPLYPRSYEYLRLLWPDPTVEGQPGFYAEHGEDHWLIAATPDSAYPWEVKGYQRPPLLSDAVQTNWLTESASLLLFERATMELADLVKNAELKAIYGGRYAQTLAAMTGEDIKKISDRAAERRQP